ncbi:MAG: tolB protein precursor, partial [Bacteroidales bacterium]|nr:tolB protein precursor [Bacteroidales bacterium]
MTAFANHIRLTGVCKKWAAVLILLTGFIFGTDAEAQYFGRNKPGYRSFRFDVVQTPAFEIYHYLKNDTLVNMLTKWSEQWYKTHLDIFRDSFSTRNPVIFYNNHPDFQQTNTISGLIGTGTGGVTESLKNRVIMPVAPSLAQTDHTLGHELVHAFQYKMFIREDSLRRMSINNIPLWMVEG